MKKYYEISITQVTTKESKNIKTWELIPEKDFKKLAKVLKPLLDEFMYYIEE